MNFNPIIPNEFYYSFVYSAFKNYSYYGEMIQKISDEIYVENIYDIVYSLKEELRLFIE